MPFSEDLSPEEVQQLVLLAQQGDTNAYETLVRLYTPKLLSMTQSMLRNTQDAQDVVQDALIRAYRALDKFKAQSSFYTWIYRITYNLALNFIKAKKRKRQVSMQALEENTGANTSEYQDSSIHSDPTKILEINHLQKKLNDALSQLSEKHRAVVIMFDIDDLSHKEIAEILQISIGTVRSRLHYAHQQLQTLLDDIN